ncbi:MAG: PASTA domain-containing protein [Microbacterium sp.]|nr:PASTA domain-containing protein [Microbacterium sp.]
MKDELGTDAGGEAHGDNAPSGGKRSRRLLYIGGAAVVAAALVAVAAFVIVDQVTRVSVPNVEQQTLATAKTTIDGLDLGVNVRTDSSFCDEDELGPDWCVVTSQTPAEGERIHVNEVVTLEVAPTEVSVPTVVGMTFDEAVDAGAEVALEVLPADLSDRLVEGYEGWNVVAQSESGASNAGSSFKVTLERPLVDAPAIVGSTLQGAVDALTAAGFKPVVAADPGGEHDPAWVVTGSEPEIVDGKLPVAARITLTWGVQLPNVVGMTDLAAKSALSNAKVTVEGSKSSSQLVAAQDPAAGTVVQPESKVTIALEPPSTVYEVVGNGSRATITWIPPNSYSISQAGDTPLPWRMSWPTSSGYANFNAQIMDGNSVTCNIYVNGQLVKTATSTGQYAVVSCG